MYVIFHIYVADNCIQDHHYVKSFDTEQEAIDYKNESFQKYKTSLEDRSKYITDWVKSKSKRDLKELLPQFSYHERDGLISHLTHSNFESIYGCPDFHPTRLLENPYDWYILEVPDGN